MTYQKSLESGTWNVNGKWKWCRLVSAEIATNLVDLFLASGVFPVECQQCQRILCYDTSKHLSNLGFMP